MISNINDLLKSAVVTEDAIRFHDDSERTTFLEAKKLISKIGGKWAGGKDPRFKLEFNATSLIQKFLADGSWPKKNKWSFFPTPKNVVDYIIKYSEASPEHFTHYTRPVRILEPSAGRGNLAIALRDNYKAQGIQTDIVCVELDPINAIHLRKEGFNVIEADFLTLSKDELGEFDIVVMNPPFNGSECADHVRHAQTFLPKFRFVVAVLPTTLFSSPYKKTKKLCHDISIINMGEFDECIFDGDTFEDTKVETMVINFPSDEISDKDTNLAYELFADEIFVTIKNDEKLNYQSNMLKTKESAIEFVKGVTQLNTLKFTIANEATISLCASDLLGCSEIKDSYTEKNERLENQASNSLEAGDEKITELLSSINKTLPNADTQTAMEF